MGDEVRQDEYKRLRAVSSNWADGFETGGAAVESTTKAKGESVEPAVPEPVKTKAVKASAGRQHSSSDARSVLDIGTTGYPYVLFNPDICGFSPKDRFTLETSDGSFRETLLLEEAKRTPTGQLVLWFPLPPAGSRCGLRVDPPGGEDGEPYYIFKDQTVTYR